MAEYNESQINSNETERISAEQQRIENEAQRQTKETEREAREATRQSNETTRISKEAERLAEEVNRVEAEASRVTAEQGRQEAENIRAEFYEGFNERLNEAETQLAHIALNINNFKHLVIDNKWDNALKECLKISNNVIIPEGEYVFEEDIIIDKNNITIKGVNDCIGGNTVLTFINSKGLIIDTKCRFTTIKNITLKGNNNGSGIKFTSENKNGGHFITIENLFINNFDKGIELAKDGNSFLWNCTFKDIRINYCNYGISMAYNGSTNFGLLFERVYLNRCVCNLDLYAVNGVFNLCNFGLTNTNSFMFGDICNIDFNSCNFECDSYIEGDKTIISLSSKSFKFSNCGFVANVSNNVTFFQTFGNVESLIFENCRYKGVDNNAMVDFISKKSNAGKYAIKYLGGCKTLPKPDFYSAQLSNFIDDNSFPLMNANTSLPTTVGSLAFDNSLKLPCFFNGSEMVDFNGNLINSTSYPIKINSKLYLDGGEVTIPISGFVEINYNRKKAGKIYTSLPNTNDIVILKTKGGSNNNVNLYAYTWDESEKTFKQGLNTEIIVSWYKITD